MPQQPSRRQPIDIEALWGLERIVGLAVAPDGHAAACAVTS